MIKRELNIKFVLPNNRELLLINFCFQHQAKLIIRFIHKPYKCFFIFKIN